MPNYRRLLIPGGTYFFTVVTFERRPIFVDASAVELLAQVLRGVRASWPFHTVAMVVLPDHVHCIWTLPRGDADYSMRWLRIKRRFSLQWCAGVPAALDSQASRRRKGEQTVWQRRFWERWIRDEAEFEHYCAYIHYNPVKHGLVQRPADWPWSTFHRFVACGDYPLGWGRTEPLSALARYDDYGEARA